VRAELVADLAKLEHREPTSPEVAAAMARALGLLCVSRAMHLPVENQSTVLGFLGDRKEIRLRRRGNSK